jgi:hypothetical protein
VKHPSLFFLRDLNVIHALVLLLCAAAPGGADGRDNLDFSTGTLASWEGKGFYLTAATGDGPTLRFGVCSSDNGTPGRTGHLQRTLVVPEEGGYLRCTAFAHCRGDGVSEGKLDIIVVGPDQKVVPKQVFLGRGWTATRFVLSASKQQPREYQWDLSAHRGKTLRIVLADDDARPGCHLCCSGFRILASSAIEEQDFGRFMVHLSNAHNLAPMARFDTRHFTALSNAADDYTEARLLECETIYRAFYEHFRRRGFELSKPADKLMVAIFDDQKGFEAYLGKTLPVTVAGTYDRQSNRLVVYDFGQNSAFVREKTAELRAAQLAATELERQRNSGTINRRARDIRASANTVTIMHEAAHQLSFNSGLLQRDKDVPLWLAEGMACYCEATVDGVWQGVGEMNQERILNLSDGGKARDGPIPLRSLIGTDQWVRGPSNVQAVLLGYGQSWALFRMLMEERPKAMRAYLELIKDRRTPDYRLDDFRQAFGNDLDQLQQHYLDYVKQLIQQEYRPRR